MMKRNLLPAFFGLALLWKFQAPLRAQTPLTAALAARPITLPSLLREMTDFDAIARWPRPAYTTHQASSYDRASKTPQDEKGWFANQDWSQYVRSEKNGGRTEWVLMDASGPGCITRMWAGGQRPPGRLRFYIDGALEPVLDAPAYELLSGHGPIPTPLSIENSPVGGDTPGGMNSWLPIPYARAAKITYAVDGPDAEKPPPLFWYNIEFRTYEANTPVESFTPASLAAARPQIEAAGRALMQPAAPTLLRTRALNRSLKPGATTSLNLPRGNAAVRQIAIRLATARREDWEQALRSTILIAEFDGEQTVWCPVGDFSGGGVGAKALQSWNRSVAADGTLTCRWVMPYEKSGRISLLNTGKIAVAARLAVGIGAWKWDERSLHFHSTWRLGRDIATRPFSDWNYVWVKGRGRYVGDALSVFNTVGDWWGEGDEKVWVDGEAFPSHFGTGTEDLYCYAWGNTRLFQSPFANEVRADGSNGHHIGHTSVTRTRSLDSIPFDKNLRFDLEIWHWADTKMTLAATSYWYARPGAQSNRVPSPENSARPLPQMPPPRVVKGAIEAETAAVAAKSEGLTIETQRGRLLAEGQWSSDAQLFVRAAKVGDWIELRFPAPDTAPRTITVYPTKSHDYGILKLSINGQASQQVDTYSARPILGEEMVLGTFVPQDGQFVLRIEVAGSNPAADGTKCYFGIDCVTLSKAGR